MASLEINKIIEKINKIKKCLMLIFIFSIFSTQISAKSSQKSDLWGDLQKGKYKVGFNVKTFTDKTRKNSDMPTSKRQIEAMIWFPINPNPNTLKITFKDYASYLTTFRKGYTKAEIQDWLSTSISGNSKGIKKEKLNKILEAKMFAVKNSNAINKSFPLILWTMRHETFIAQSILCELLASHGYVVASARYAGKPMPFPWAIKTPDKKLEVFNTHLQDLEFTLKSLSKEKNVNPSKVAIMNWSYAAELSPAIQMRNSNIKLVIGLSSNPLSSFGLYQDNTSSNLKINKLNVPYVIMSELVGTDGKERLAPKILNQLPTESYFISFPKLTHGNFNVLEGMIPGVFNIEKVQSWSKGGKTAKIGFEAISQYTLFFLNKYLKKKNSFSVKKLNNQFPKDFARVTRFRKNIK